jgi:hypothetical protein
MIKVHAYLTPAISPIVYFIRHIRHLPRPNDIQIKNNDRSSSIPAHAWAGKVRYISTNDITLQHVHWSANNKRSKQGKPDVSCEAMRKLVLLKKYSLDDSKDLDVHMLSKKLVSFYSG